MMALERVRKGREGCPSDLRLDRHVAGELAGADAEAVEAHLAGCAACSEHVAKAREGLGAFPEIDAAKLRARVLERAVAPRPRRKWAAIAFAAAPLAAAAIVVLTIARKPPADAPTAGTDPAPLGVRAKGAPVLHVFRKTASGAEELVSGARVHPGDRLRFGVDLPSAGEVAIVGVDASREVYVAWPLEEGARTALAAGAAQELPGAVALDDAEGKETLYLVHCPGASEPPRCERTPAGPPRCPPGCSVGPFVLDKVRE